MRQTLPQFHLTSHFRLTVAVGGIGAFLMAGCEFKKSSWTTYEEITTDPPSFSTSQKPSTTHKPIALQWTTPAGWNEQQGGDLRLATFTIDRNGSTATCTFITLGGAAGGIEANVRRWIGQLKLEEPTDVSLEAFLARQQVFHSDGGFHGTIIDLTEMGDKTPDAASMLAAIIPLEGSTLFVKLTGPRSLLNDEKESFTKLCKSITKKI